jgi:hypothetical protein
MPTPTDLVTDLPADFEVFGQAVATSLADLLGGTTDQVLAKNSNTDMDFKWVTSDDANAIQNAIVNAKGDIIGASANDTPAITSVGANDLVLTAASGETTGLKWAGAGVAYTPTITGNSAFTLGNGTLNGRYVQVGKTVTATVNLVCGSTTSLPTSFTYVSLPVTAQNNYAVGGVHYEDSPGGTNYENNVILANTTTALLFTPAATDANSAFFNATSPFTFGSGDLMRFSITYEAA